jgi:ribosomal protein S18 acetylase RimI-like enzyme
VLPWLFELVLVAGLDRGTLYATAGQLDGVALWVPPGAPRRRPSASSFVSVPVRLGRALPRLMRVARSTVDLEHRASPLPHWYLSGIGVEPERQGRGIGSALMRAGLARADAAGEHAVLITHSPDNLPFYERHGFTVVVEEDIPGGGPPAWAMARKPGG